MHPNSQSTFILQQFNMIVQELRNFMEKVSSDINKISQACTAAQVKTGKLIENSIAQGLTRPQNIMPPNPAIDCRTFGQKPCIKFFLQNNLDCILAKKQYWHTTTPTNEANHLQGPYEIPVSPYTYVGQQPPNPTPFNFNQSVVKLFRNQTELIHSTQ